MSAAEEAYASNHAEALSLLAKLQECLENLPAPDGLTQINWGHAGSLEHVSQKLSEVLEFLGG